ncbi:MAG: NUDIX domain-containing protein [Pedosphaera sp.]|nr:NUDIX domain-containing protein [Pedosphaera sp.]
MIRNIIFDWSGTLVDDLPAVWEATNHVFEQAGKEPFTIERFRAEFCLPFKKFYDQHLTSVPMEQMEQWFHERFRQVQDQVEALPHAKQFLELCRERGIRSFLLSALHEVHYVTQAERTGFGQFIERPYLGVHDKRPAILELLKENGLSPAETLFIGDMKHDIETAKHGGVFSCAVLTGYTGLEQLKESGPDLIVEHLGELREVLEAHGWFFPPAPGASRHGGRRLPLAAVGALIFNMGGQVLMIQTHKWSGLWGIPGGKIKFGERSEDALQREVKEETNLEIDEIEFILVQDCIQSAEFYRDEHFLLLNYTCRALAGTPVELNEEAQAFKWVGLDQAMKLELNTPTRVLIEAVLSRESKERRSVVDTAKGRPI